MSKRNLSADEIKDVLKKIDELNKEKRDKAYKEMGLDDELIEMMKMADSGKDERDKADNTPYLRYEKFEVSTTITDIEIEEIARQAIDMKPAAKWERISELSTEDRRLGRESMEKDVKDAAEGRKAKRKATVKRAKDIIEIAKTAVNNAEQLVKAQEKTIESIERDLERKQAVLASLLNGQAKVEKENPSGSKETVFENLDDEERFNEKIKKAQQQISKAENRLYRAKTELENRKRQLAFTKDELSKLEMQISMCLAKQGLSLEDEIEGTEKLDVEDTSERTHEAQSAGSSLPSGANNNEKQGPKFLQKISKEIARRGETRTKADNVIYGFLETGTPETIEEYFKNGGDISTLAESLRKLGNIFGDTSDVKDFKETLRQIMEKKLRRNGRYLGFDNGGECKIGSVKIKIEDLDSEKELDYKTIKKIERGLGELYQKDELSPKEQDLMMVLQMAILRDTKHRLRLPFNWGRSKRVALDNAAKNIGIYARARRTKIKENREFAERIRAIRGGMGENRGTDRAYDPITIRFDRSDTLSNVGDTSNLDDQQR